MRGRPFEVPTFPKLSAPLDQGRPHRHPGTTTGHAARAGDEGALTKIRSEVADLMAAHPAPGLPAH